MVKIIYDKHEKQADIAGKSVAQVRKLYKTEFSLPDRAKASLNGKELERKQEPETRLGDRDDLSFEVKSRKGLVTLGAFLLTLVITGGLFAYTYLTATATIDATTATNNFAAVTANNTVASYQPFGKARGAISAGNLFNVTKTSGYTGDLEVTVYLSNPDELTKNYRYWMLRLEFVNSANTTVDAEGITQVLSMENGVATFYVPSANVTGGTPYYVLCQGGSYMALPWIGAGWTTYDPLLFCQITQAGP
jgi:hypothetical protein